MILAPLIPLGLALTAAVAISASLTVTIVAGMAAAVLIYLALGMALGIPLRCQVELHDFSSPGVVLAGYRRRYCTRCEREQVKERRR